MGVAGEARSRMVVDMTVSERVPDTEAWYTLTAADAAAHLGVRADLGLSAQDVEERLTTTDGTSCRPSHRPASGRSRAVRRRIR